MTAQASSRLRPGSSVDINAFMQKFAKNVSLPGSSTLSINEFSALADIPNKTYSLAVEADGDLSVISGFDLTEVKMGITYAQSAVESFEFACNFTIANAPLVYSRICMYCDTADGDFWIAADPDRPWLVIAAGDNGHGFKFAPVLGEIIADATEGKSNQLLDRFRWRPEVPFGARKEAARPQLSS